MPFPLPKDRKPWLWFLAAFLVGAARCHEAGLSLDPSLYAAIARTLSRDGEIWSLKANEFLFPQFYEHPFLAMWLQALVFKVLGVSDTATRYLGLLFGAGTFFYLYRIARQVADEKYASVYLFLTLFSVYFTGRIPSLYLEVPLTFFMVASLHYFLRAVPSGALGFAALSGAFLGAAFLTKGLAAVPMAATLGGVALYRQRGAILRSPSLPVTFLVASGVVAVFALLQHNLGSYSFVTEYLRISWGGKVFGSSAILPGWPFVKKLLETHGIHILLAAAVVVPLARGQAPREAVAVGAIGSFFFILANGKLGKTHLHYFYTIYPMINFLAAATLYPWVASRAIRWERIAIGFALVYLVFWHLVPIHMRRWPWVDYYQLSGPARALRDAGVSHVQTPISWTDWGYRQLSFWYWDLPSEVDVPPERMDAAAVVVPRGEASHRERVRAKGYLECAHSPRFVLYVDSPRLQSACQRAAFPKEFLR